MPRRATRYLVAAVLAAACQGAAAQATVPPAVLVQQLAPHLLQFAGSLENFQNLVNGLAQGTPIQLTTLLPGGFTQVVSFTPSGAGLTPVQIAQILESTRQQLIGLGVGNPSGEQIGAVLTGTRVPTPASPTLQTQNNSTVANPLSVQNVPNIAASGATALPRVNTSDSSVPAGATSRTPLPGNVSNTPVPPVATPTPAPSTPASMTPSPPPPANAARPMR